jgi:hypothetical protein
LSERGGDPLLPLALFRERGFSAGLTTQLFLASVQATFFVYLALYLQLGRGLGPLESGSYSPPSPSPTSRSRGPLPGSPSASGES